MLRAVIRIGGTHFAIFLGNVTRTQRMRAALLMDLVRILRVAASRITIDRLTLGSLIVELSVSRDDATSTMTTPPSPAAVAGLTAVELEAAITGIAASSSAAWLVNTSRYYRDEYVAVTPGGNATVDSLTVLSASSTIVSVPSPTGTASGGNAADATSDGCGGQCVVFYAGIALALVLLAGALFAFVVFLHRRRGGRAGAEKRADGHDQSPPTINWGDDGYDHGNMVESSDWGRRSGAGWAPTHTSKQATHHPYGGQTAANGGRRH